jgi:hypothetical protein
MLPSRWTSASLAVMLLCGPTDAQQPVGLRTNPFTGQGVPPAAAYNPLTGQITQQGTNYNALTGAFTNRATSVNPLTGQAQQTKSAFNPLTDTAMQTWQGNDPLTGASASGTTSYNPLTGQVMQSGSSYNPVTGQVTGGSVSYNPFTSASLPAADQGRWFRPRPTPLPQPLPGWNGRGVLNPAVRQVMDWYQRYLRRRIDPEGARNWAAVLRTQGPTAALSGILGSDEYYQILGSNDPAFVAGLYQDVLRRPASRDEVILWLGQLAVHGDRARLATEFLTAAEAEMAQNGITP